MRDVYQPRHAPMADGTFTFARCEHGVTHYDYGRVCGRMGRWTRGRAASLFRKNVNASFSSLVKCHAADLSPSSYCRAVIGSNAARPGRARRSTHPSLPRSLPAAVGVSMSDVTASSSCRRTLATVDSLMASDITPFAECITGSHNPDTSQPRYQLPKRK